MCLMSNPFAAAYESDCPENSRTEARWTVKYVAPINHRVEYRCICESKDRSKHHRTHYGKAEYIRPAKRNILGTMLRKI